MRLSINDNRKIAQIQEEFSQAFPYLRLEFYSRPHRNGEGTKKNYLVPGVKTLREIRSVHTSGALEITPDMTVSILEKEFGDVYGLGVQVFRKSGAIWLQTTVTDEWSLEKQNAEGAALNSAADRA